MQPSISAGGRRLLLLGGLAPLGLGLTLMLGVRGVAAQRGHADDRANVQALLEAMRGTAPVPCALALGVVEGNGGWGGRDGGSSALEDSATSALRDWLDQGLHDPAVVPVLAAALAPGDACVRQTAARLLGRSQDLAAVRALTAALHDADPVTRELGALGLGISGDPAGYQPLLGALRDPVVRVRATAALALGRLGDQKAATDLLPLLAHDPAPEVRRAAAIAIGRLN